MTAEALLGCAWLPWNVAKAIAAIAIRIIAPFFMPADDD